MVLILHFHAMVVDQITLIVMETATGTRMHWGVIIVFWKVIPLESNLINTMIWNIVLNQDFLITQFTISSFLDPYNDVVKLQNYNWLPLHDSKAKHLLQQYSKIFDCDTISYRKKWVVVCEQDWKEVYKNCETVQTSI